MIRRIALLASVAALALAFSGLAPASAVAPPPPSGTLSCTLSGTATLKPGLPLSSPGLATKVVKTKISFTGTLSACNNAGQIGGKAPITGGSVKAKGTAVTAIGDPLPSCLGLATPPVTPTVLKVSTKFTGDPVPPKTKPVTVSSSSGPQTLGTATVGPVISFPTSGVIAKGGFLGETATTTATLDLDLGGLVAACSAPGGLTTLAFTGVKGPSTVAIAP